jgi:hypothetical protein
MCVLLLYLVYCTEPVVYVNIIAIAESIDNAGTAGKPWGIAV